MAGRKKGGVETIITSFNQATGTFEGGNIIREGESGGGSLLRDPFERGGESFSLFQNKRLKKRKTLEEERGGKREEMEKGEKKRAVERFVQNAIAERRVNNTGEKKNKREIKKGESLG